jgi:hypothetical protein
MKKITWFTLIAAVALAGSFLSNSVAAKDDAEKQAKKMAKWQEDAKNYFDMTYDKFTTMSIITSKRLAVAKRGIVSVSHNPNIDMVVSFSYKGVDMVAKPATLDLYLFCEVREKTWPIHQPAAADKTPNANNSLVFLVDDKPLQIDAVPAYAYQNHEEALKYTITLQQFTQLASGSVIQARLGTQEFEVKDFPLVVLKETLTRFSTVK